MRVLPFIPLPAHAGGMHYRQLDISALALAAMAWVPELAKEAIEAKQYKHEALADIRESIAELKCYRQALFGGNANG